MLLVSLCMPILGKLSRGAGLAAVAHALGGRYDVHDASTTFDAGDDPVGVTHRLLSAAGGPLVALTCGTLGALCLALDRHRRSRLSLGPIGASALMLALFWTRHPFNAGLAARQKKSGFESDAHRASCKARESPH